MCLYRLPEESEGATDEPTSPELKLQKNLPSNKPFKVQVHVYIICVSIDFTTNFCGSVSLTDLSWQPFAMSNKTK